MSSSKDNIGIILAWLDGYYKENNAPPIFDSDKFKKDSENLAKYCADHPTAGLITAADETLGK